jgi:hypothetical protein
MKQLFELTEDHIALLRNMWVQWQEDEFGAPEIDPKRPYGDSSVHKNLKEILGKRPIATLNKIHKETETALQIVLATGSFKPGWYEADQYDKNWVKVQR